MDLDRLLQDFDEIIAARGKKYYDEGRVTELEEMSPGEFFATVEGSEDYEVTVTLSDDQNAEYICDCPYWGAPYCKHAAAVLFAINAQYPQAANESTGRQNAVSPLSTQALRALPPDTLIALLQDAAEKFPEVKDWLRARVAPGEEDVQAYRKLIRSSIQSRMEKGYIPYRQMPAALRGAQEALDRLEEVVQTNDYGHVLDFAFMVIGEVARLLERVDDSDGEVSGIIESCFESIEKVYQDHVRHGDEAEQAAFCRRLMNGFESPMLQGYEDWKERLADMCVAIADRFPSLRPPLLALRERGMQTPSGDDYDRKYAIEQAQLAYYAMLQRWEGADIALQFALQHMENDDLRTYVYEFHLENKQLQEALKVCLEGERLSQNSFGIMSRWRERRFELYGLMEDADSQRALSEEFLLENGKDYYDRLRSYYAAGQWAEKREALLERMKNSGCLHSAYLQIITGEKDRPRILAYIRDFPDSVFQLYPHLLPDFQDEAQALFRKALLQSASGAAQRKAYREVCQQIIVYGRACGAAPAKDLIEELRAAYPRKTVFQEELRAAAVEIEAKPIGRRKPVRIL
ncbi:MAG: hypothetical protein GX608_07790 [Lentisphaerae bacterium]|nr:hypothetical protein [Lentisphaerota bacterium]